MSYKFGLYMSIYSIYHLKLENILKKALEEKPDDYCEKLCLLIPILIYIHIQVSYLPMYNAHSFLTNFASKIEMCIIHRTFCFHVR